MKGEARIKKLRSVNKWRRDENYATGEQGGACQLYRSHWARCKQSLYEVLRIRPNFQGYFWRNLECLEKKVDTGSGLAEELKKGFTM
jgi:hypothetical protein